MRAQHDGAALAVPPRVHVPYQVVLGAGAGQGEAGAQVSRLAAREAYVHPCNPSMQCA